MKGAYIGAEGELISGGDYSWTHFFCLQVVSLQLRGL